VRKEVVDFRSDVNKRLDETNKRIEALNDSLSREISEVRDALNRRIDKTNRRIGTLYNLLGKIYEALIKVTTTQKQ